MPQLHVSWLVSCY